jgi:hypothetical protein
LSCSPTEASRKFELQTWQLRILELNPLVRSLTQTDLFSAGGLPFAKTPPLFPKAKCNLACSLTSVVITNGLNGYSKEAIHPAKWRYPANRPPFQENAQKVAGFAPESVARLAWNTHQTVFAHNLHIISYLPFSSCEDDIS